MEVEEQAGRDAASAAGARRANLTRGAESFIMIVGSEVKGDGVCEWSVCCISRSYEERANGEEGIFDIIAIF